MTSELAATVIEAIEAGILATAVGCVYRTTGDTTEVSIEIPLAGFGAYRSDQIALSEGRPIIVTVDDVRDLLVFPNDREGEVVSVGLAIAGVPYEPNIGDEVDVELASGTKTFVVGPVDPEPCWRWTDRFETARRIHMRAKTE